jgi:hypothetical protein
MSPTGICSTKLTEILPIFTEIDQFTQNFAESNYRKNLKKSPKFRFFIGLRACGIPQLLKT